MEQIELTLLQYEEVRREPTRFIVKPDHVLATDERVIKEHRDYAIVEKTGRAGERAQQLDERSG